MDKEKIILFLEEIVGERWVTDDPSVLICYARDQSLEISKAPEFVVLPESTEEISQILKFSQENKISVVPWSAGVNSGGGCIPQRGGIILDLKRMDKILDIDIENMTATIQPGVNFGRIQVEALKHGLRVINPTAPASASCLANFLDKGIGMASNKYGVGTDHIVNMKLVLPNGEILNTSSEMSNGNAKILAPPLGIDISGIFHASMGVFGICTEMIIKLYTVPKIDGLILLAYKKDKYDYTEEIMRELVKEESVIELFMWQDVYLVTGIAPTNQAADRMLDVIGMLNHKGEIGDILFIGYGGNDEEEFAFHKKRLTKICEGFVQKYGEEEIMLNDEQFTKFFENVIKMPLSFRIIRESPKIERIRGSFFINWFNTDLTKCGEIVREYKRLTTLNMSALIPKDKHELTYFPDDLVTIYVQPLEYGRTAMLECDFFPDQADPESMKRSIKNAFDVIKMTLDHDGQYDRPYGGVESGFGGLQTPRLGTYYILLKELKNLIDPNNIMNPGRLALPVD